MKITKEFIDKYGQTPGCIKCARIELGRNSIAAHSEECRQRIYKKFQSEADENWARVERERKTRSAATAAARPARIIPEQGNVDLDAADVEAPSKKPRVEPSATPDENEADVADVVGDVSDDDVEEPDAKRARRVPEDDDIDERYPPGDYRRHRGLVESDHEDDDAVPDF